MKTKSSESASPRLTNRELGSLGVIEREVGEKKKGKEIYDGEDRRNKVVEERKESEVE